MEILAFTHLAADHESPYGHTYRSIDWPSLTLPHLPSGRWIGLTTTALSLAIIMAAPGAMALVRRGDTGDEVSQLQNELDQAGYSVGVIDGIFGAGTENALISFQTKYGLVADGIAGPATFAKLEEVNSPSDGGGTSADADVLTIGASGDPVMALQTKLKELGFFPNSVEISGYYGPVTADAVRRFQQANDLGADGIAGPATQAKLFGNNAVSQNESEDQVTTASTSASTTSDAQMLAFGQTNDAVVKLQDRLKELGYLSKGINSTGYFGELTLNAVKAFQEKNSLTADGLVGPRTQTALGSDSAIAASTSEPTDDATVSNTNATDSPEATPTIRQGTTLTIRTNGGRLNVRSAPNTASSTIRGSLGNGESVEAKGVTIGDWVEIENGWVHKDYIEVAQ